MGEQDPIQEVRENLLEIKGLLNKVVETNQLKFEIIEEKLKVANNRIKDLEESNTWVWRAFAGACITAVVALLFTLK